MESGVPSLVGVSKRSEQKKYTEREGGPVRGGKIRERLGQNSPLPAPQHVAASKVLDGRARVEKQNRKPRRQASWQWLARRKVKFWR